ncbi:uncharacterized protein LOC130744048 [Lotus japonicus]|uniref:uncharacterized protein LOC130744048 n=1 Tax=Lotus japonicus TaxID=34305 RepID=UPI00258D144F|nr:uncharacterized protein LOC130744048 [Lotus japonicus]
MDTAMKCFSDWLAALEKYNQTKPETREEPWKAPAIGWIKFNIDAGWTGESSTGFGFVARDTRGVLMVAGSQIEEQRMDPLLAEAMALRWCLMTAKELGMDSVIFESDSLSVINAMRTDSTAWTIQTVIQDCKALARSFPSISFSHVRRKANSPAHILASVACKYLSKIWWDSTPNEKVHALIVDSTFSD